MYEPVGEKVLVREQWEELSQERINFKDWPSNAKGNNILKKEIELAMPVLDIHEDNE